MAFSTEAQGPLRFPHLCRQKWRPYVHSCAHHYLLDIRIYLQMANRSSLSADSATNALQRTTLNDPRLPPSFTPTQSMRPPPSRRPKPGLKLSNLDNPLTSIGGGTTGAGLGASRPSFSIDTSLPKRQAHNFGTPFSNFGKIV